MPTIKRLLLILPLLFAGCAVISEDECRAGNWYERGVQDGARGRDQAMVKRIAEQCQEYGVQVDNEAWYRGHEEGVEKFCTPDNGYRYGRQGRRYSGVCTGPTADLFVTAYRQGLADHQVVQQYRQLAARQDWVRQQLYVVEVAMANTADRNALSSLAMRRTSLQFELQRLDMAMFRFDAFGGFGAFDRFDRIGSFNAFNSLGLDFLY
ncbi:DUF2799 domain-containing protein [Microbulbifer sp. SAOS-129_SWC]|uniref:DUF2799 domain-containing protein n=1 Tax=Microbulbifer sp. SAOS-129_SWC TaxID=3145235 RepID=UPI003217C70F